MRRIPLAVLAALCACTTSNLGNPAQLSFTSPGTVVAGEFIIDANLDDGVLADLGIDKLHYDEVLGAGLYRADAGTSVTAMRAVLRDHLPLEVGVEENRTVSALGTNDDYRGLQWNLDMLDIDTAWTHSTGEGIVVAVIDSGVATHGEDTPLKVLAGWDYVDNDADPTDENGHGTHVAGTIAQATNNNRGVAGVAPDAAILPIRTLDASGSGSVYWSATGIRWATDQGADVINMSLGSPYRSGVEEQAIAYAVAHGVILVAASGNDGKGTLDFPAGYDDVISVGAVGGSGAVTSYSNRGSTLDLVAPGGDMGRDFNGDGYGDGILQETLSGNGGTSYQFFEGTSMATPHVAAAAALLLAAGADPADIRDLLTDHATDIGAAGWDSTSGSGLLNVVAALEAVAGSPGGGGGGDTTPPADTTAPVISGVGGSRTGNSMRISWTTDEPSSTEVDFRDYGLFGDPAARVTAHEMNFTVDPNATYYFTVVSVDEAGNRSEDGVWYLSP